MTTSFTSKPELRKKKHEKERKRAVVKKIRDKEEWLQKELDSVVQPKEVVEEPDVEDSDAESEQEDIADLPFIPIREETAEESEGEDEGPTVVYLGHLPFGFEEFQLAEYFKQFGAIKRSFISRSKKTGQSRGYGFVEFRHSETAQIAADTMNDYLMFKKRLISRVIPKTESSKIQWLKDPPTSTLFNLQRDAATRYNANHKPDSLQRLVFKENKKREKLKKLGINYEFDGYTTLVNERKQEEEERKRGREGEGEEGRSSKRARGVKKEEKESKEKEKEEEGEEGEGEEDKEEAVWDARKQAKLAGDLTGSQKRKLLTQHLIDQTRKNKKAQKANGTQKKTPASTPAKQTVAKKTPTKETAPQKTPAKETPKTPAKDTATPKTPAKETPKTPAKDTVTPKTPAKDTVTPKTPAKETPKTPAKETPKTPAKETATPKTPAGKASGTPSKTVSTPKHTPAKTPQSKKKRTG